MYMVPASDDAAMAGNPPFLAALEDHDPEFAELIAPTRSESRTEGALSAKTKALIAMALDAGMNHPNGVESLSDAARDAGATEDEVLETVEVVASMCGLQGLATGMNAFPDEDR